MVITRVLLIALWTSTITVALAGEVEVAAPAALPDGDAFLIAIIPDLRATLTKFEHIAGMFSPVPLPPGTLTTSFGAALGDPGLANLGKGPVLVVVGPGVPTPTIALLLPGIDAKRYVDLAAQKGFLMGSVVKDVAVVSQTPEGQALGEKIAAASLPVTAVTDIRLMVAPDRLVKSYGAFLTGMVKMAAMNMPQKPGEMPMAKVLSLEVAGLQEIGAALNGMQLDITITDGTVGLDALVAAIPGSPLAKALVPPAPGVNHAAQRFNPAPAALAFNGRLNVTALQEYLLTVVQALRATPDGKDLITQEFIDGIKESIGVWTGDFAVRMRAGEKAPVLMEAVGGITDPAKAEHGWDVMSALFSGDSAVGKMYQGMGLTMKVTKNARTTGGLPVIIQSWVLDEAKLAQTPDVKAMLHDTQIVFGKDFMASAQDPQFLDALVAGGGSGLTTKAEKTMGAGRNAYGDVDMVALIMAQMQAIMPGAGDKAKLPPGDPITVAFTMGTGRMRIEEQIPLAPFVTMTTAMQGMGPQRQPHPPVAQPPPNGGNTF